MKATELLTALSILGLTFCMHAESPQTPSITDKINGGGSIVVVHPSQLEQRIKPNHAETSEVVAEPEENESPKTTVKRLAGYRVQVFSDNNVRTAKAEAKRKARAVADAFPQYPTYVVYTSPYWRLKVGDFKSHEDAEVAATAIKRAFPAYAREVRVVRDRINGSR